MKFREDIEGYREYIENQYNTLRNFITEMDIKHTISYMNLSKLNVDELEQYSKYLNNEANKVEEKREIELRKLSKSFGMYQMEMIGNE